MGRADRAGLIQDRTSVPQSTTSDAKTIAAALQRDATRLAEHHENPLRLAELLKHAFYFTELLPQRRPLACGCTSSQLDTNLTRDAYVAVGRPELTWKIIGFAEALGLQVDHMDAVIHCPRAGLFVLWRGDEAGASIRAWQQAEQRLNLPSRAKHVYGGW